MKKVMSLRCKKLHKLLSVRICELISTSLLEAPPNVNMSDQDDNKLQNSMECND